MDGSYSASNAYGASRIVNKTKNTQITLWQQRAYGAHNAFPENELGSVADLQVGPEQARLLKKSLKFAHIEWKKITNFCIPKVFFSAGTDLKFKST